MRGSGARRGGENAMRRVHTGPRKERQTAREARCGSLRTIKRLDNKFHPVSGLQASPSEAIRSMSDAGSPRAQNVARSSSFGGTQGHAPHRVRPLASRRNGETPQKCDEKSRDFG